MRQKSVRSNNNNNRPSPTFFLSFFLSCGESSLQVGKLELSLSHSLLQLVFHSAAALAAASTAAVSATASTYEVSECLEHTSITEISKVIYQNVVESWTLTIDQNKKSREPKSSSYFGRSLR